MRTRNLDLAQLVLVSPRVDGIEVAEDKRRKSSGFTCADPLKPWIMAKVRVRVRAPRKFDARDRLGLPLDWEGDVGRPRFFRFTRDREHGLGATGLFVESKVRQTPGRVH